MVTLFEIDDRQSVIEAPRYSFQRVGKLNFNPNMPKEHQNRVKFLLGGKFGKDLMGVLHGQDELLGESNYLSHESVLFNFPFVFPRLDVSIFCLEFDHQVSNAEAVQVQSRLGHEPAGIGHLLFYGGDKVKNLRDMWVVAPQVCVLPKTKAEYVPYFGDSGLWGFRGDAPMSKVHLSGRRAIGLRPFEDEWPAGTKFLSVKRKVLVS